MKKLLSIVMIMALGLGFVACKGGSTDPKDIVAKAKTEGANWSVDQWKDAAKNMLVAMKPMITEVLEMQKKAEANPDKELEIIAEMAPKMKEFEEASKLMEEFETVAKATENGKTVMNDEEWLKSVAKEMGIPEDAF